MKSDKTILRETVAQAMVDMWLADGTTYDLQRRVCAVLKKNVDMSDLCAVLGVTWMAERQFKGFAHAHFRMFSDTMWEGRSNARQILAARRVCGLKAKRNTGASLPVGTRAQDKSFDWSTVK